MSTTTDTLRRLIRDVDKIAKGSQTERLNLTSNKRKTDRNWPMAVDKLNTSLTANNFTAKLTNKL